MSIAQFFSYQLFRLKQYVYKDMLIEATIYNRKTRQMNQIYNYDNLLYTLFLTLAKRFGFMQNFCWTTNDLIYIVSNPYILVSCRFMLNGHYVSYIFSQDSLESYNMKNDMLVSKKLTYAVLNDEKCITKKVKNYSLFLHLNKDVKCQEFIDILFHSKVNTNKLVIMTDENYEEEVWNSDDIVTI